MINDIKLVLKWFIKHRASETGEKPNDEVKQIFKANGWTFTGIVYRGVGYFHELISLEVLQTKLHSWTKSEDIAMKYIPLSFQVSNIEKEEIIEGYLKGENPQGYVLKASIQEGLDIEEAMKEIQKVAKNHLSINWSASEREVIGTVKEIEVIMY